MLKFDEKKFLFILLFLHLAIALPLAFYLNIWVDEASTLFSTQNGFFQTFDNLFHDEKQAPVYFLLMSLWRQINDSIFFARLFSVICSLLAIIAFSRIAQKIWERKTAFFITALFALHPYLFWASLEIRLYSFIILITCWMFDFFYDGYLQNDKPSKKAQIYFVLISILALYTNYYLGFLLVGGFLALLVLRRWTEAKSYFMQMLGVNLAILPLFWIIRLQFSERVVIFQNEKSLIAGIKVLWNHFLIFALPSEIFPTEDFSVVSFVRLWLVRVAIVAIVFIIVKNKGKDLDKNILAFGTISATAAAFFLFVYFQLGASYIEIRHASVYFVAIFILVSAILVKILPKQSLFPVAILYLFFFSYSIYMLYPNLTKRGDWARVATFIEQNEKPNQPIMVFLTYDTVALLQYYNGTNKILPDEKIFSFSAEDKAGSPNHYRRQLEFIISKIPSEAEEIWLLTNENCEVGQTCQPLDNFVEANYTVIEEKDFFKEKVRLLRKK